MRSRALVVQVALLACLALLVAAPPTAASAGRPHHVAPVPGQVLRPFAPPATTYGAGHRGVDLAAAPGSPVRASAAGVVRFAGPVAGSGWVTVDHGAGLLTSYGPLRAIVVAAGAGVARSDVLGETRGEAHPGSSSSLHWSARRDGVYIDPLRLLAADPAGLTASLDGEGEWWASSRPALPRYDDWDGTHRLGLVPASPVATGPGWVTPPNANHVIGIAGLGTRTGEPPLDLTHLGYADGDVSQFSYAGARPYAPDDTWREVDAAARALEETLRRRWAEHPGQAVDLVGHSLGGLVALHYLLVHHDPLDPTLPPIGHVATIASPLEGADLASAVVAARRHARGLVVTDLAGRLVPELDPGAPVVADLATDSAVVRGLARRWSTATADPWTGPLATGTRVLTLGADGDLVVPVHRSDLPGAEHAVLPGSHDSVRDTEAARWVLRAFLADRPVPAEGGGLGHLVSHVVGWAERRAVEAVAGPGP